MDQVKTGRFIAEMRKQKGYTQKQLADILLISDKTVSKWETGNGFPEISLVIPLCRELGITANELLSGECLLDGEYKARAEENIKTLLQERRENKKKLILTFGVVALTVISSVTLMLVSELAVLSHTLRIILFCIAIFIMVLGIAIGCIMEVEAGAYECPECGERFVPTMKQFVKGSHTLTRRKLTCPACGKRKYCLKVLTKQKPQK